MPWYLSDAMFRHSYDAKKIIRQIDVKKHGRFTNFSPYQTQQC